MGDYGVYFSFSLSRIMDLEGYLIGGEELSYVELAEQLYSLVFY